MDAMELLIELEDMIEDSSKVPFGNKTMIDKERALDFIRDIRISIPDEVKQADWINKERQRILDDAKMESDRMIEEASLYVKQKVSENEIIRLAKEEADQIIEHAEEIAKDIKDGSREYALEVLRKLDTDLSGLNAKLQKNMQELREFDL